MPSLSAALIHVALVFPLARERVGQPLSYWLDENSTAKSSCNTKRKIHDCDGFGETPVKCS